MATLSKARKIWLLILAGMAVLFLMLTVQIRSHTGVMFHGSLLEVQGTVENGAYSGEAHGEDVSIVVSRESETEVGMEFYISNVVHDNWLVEYPLEPILTEHGQKLPGLRISRNGKTVFEGAYDPEHRVDWGYMLYDTDGKLYTDEMFSLSVSTGTTGGYWDDYETSLGTVLNFVNGPEITARGDMTFWFYGLLMSAMAVVLVAFPDTLFRWKHRWYVKDPEPTDFYYVENCVGAGIMTVMALVIYIVGVRTVP